MRATDHNLEDTTQLAHACACRHQHDERSSHLLLSKDWQTQCCVQRFWTYSGLPWENGCGKSCREFEHWLANGNAIGMHPSFPLPISGCRTCSLPRTKHQTWLKLTRAQHREAHWFKVWAALCAQDVNGRTYPVQIRRHVVSVPFGQSRWVR